MAVKTFTTGEVLTASDTNTYLNNGGLVYITSATASAQNRLNIPSCFSSTYDNYRVIVSGLTTSSGDNQIIRFSIAGTDTVGTSYTTQRIETNSSASSSISYTSSPNISPSFCTATANSRLSYSMDIYSPNLSAITAITGQANRIDSGSNMYLVSFAGAQLTTNAQFDGLTIAGGAGNISCVVTVYGYRKA